MGRYTALPYGIPVTHVHPTEGGGPRRSGLLRGRIPRRAPRREWQRRERVRFPRGPTVAEDGSLLIGSLQGVHAFDPRGRPLFSTRVGGVSSAPSLMPGEELAVGTRHGDLLVMDRRGRILREHVLGLPTRSSPLVLPDGSIVVTTYDRRLHRLDADLSPLFTFEAREGLPTAASRSRGGHLAFACGPELYLIDLRGHLVRSIELGGRAISTPVVARDGGLWVTTAEGEIVGVEESGRVRARHRLHARLREGLRPAIGGDGRIRVAAAEGGLVCVSPGGEERWRMQGPSAFLGPVSVDQEGTTLAIDRQGRLSAVSAAGVRLWTVELGFFSRNAPVLTPEGRIYVTTEHGTIQSWR